MQKEVIPIRTRPFGRLGWKVSEIGMGTWSMSGMWGPTDDAEAIRAIRKAIELGVNFIDTAMVYGEGRSESLIAKALEDGSREVRVASKVPPKNMEWPARAISVEEAFPAEWILECTESSLKRLKRETLDLQQLHVWSPGWLKESSTWLPAVERLKREGKIRAFGISLNDYQPDSALEVVASGLIDSVQVIYNIFEQAPAERLFPACRKHGVAVIVRVPFDEGALTGRFSEDTEFHREDWRKLFFQGNRLGETVKRTKTLDFLIRDEIQTLAQAALKFCLSDPAVSTVIPGMRTMTHVEENVSVSDGKPLRPEELKQLAAYAWSRNFYSQDDGESIFNSVIAE